MVRGYRSIELPRACVLDHVGEHPLRGEVQDLESGNLAGIEESPPDKSKASDAQDMFVRLTNANELLSDPERKRKYDDYGVTEDSTNLTSIMKHDYSRNNW